MQESIRYNNLISLISEELKSMENALKGNSSLNPELERKIQQIYQEKVPHSWLQTYLSTKPLFFFLNDLNSRVEFFNKWITNNTVPSYILSYFINPQGFISAIKQRYCIKHETGISLAKVDIESKVTNEDEENKVATKQGYLIKGLFIEGGYWDKKVGGAIRDENIQELYMPLPIVIMTPKGQSDGIDIISNIQLQAQNQNIANTIINQTHSFPVYYIPIRGTYLGRSTYVLDIKLILYRDKDKDIDENKLDKSQPEYWIKKGTCILMSKSD